MNLSKHITILSGGGSPHVESYRAVYALIEEEAVARGFRTDLVDYVGCGHEPKMGNGLNLPDAVEKVRKEINKHPAPTGSTLLCRSFGCDVGAYLLAYHAQEMAAFARIVLWGPSAYHLYWDLVARTPESTREMNEYAAKHKRGMRLHEGFWATFQPIEISAKHFRSISVEIGFGTQDQYCESAFANYLAGIIRNHTKCPVRVVEIRGADHEIRIDPKAGVPNEEHERIKQEYFQLIF